MPSMPGAEIERKVRQLDNDVTDIYSMLSSIQAVQQRQGHRLDEIDRKLHEHDARFDAHDARFDAHDARFDVVEGKLDEVLELLRSR